MKTENFRKDVKLAVKGDCEAFSRLYAIVYEDLYHVAFYSLRNTHDASDAVSETVLDAFSSIHNLRNENAFKSWIFKILAVKIKKKQAEYHNFASDIDDVSEYEETLRRTFDFEHLEIAEAMYKIDDTERLILSLSVLDGYSSSEISKICGINSATVRSKLSRTKEKLRSYLTV
jgi:RNA polymerase sigma-70 factor (ECF subfamily)